MLILVLDDEPLWLRLMSRTLEGAGRVLTARQPERALELLSRAPVDAIVADLNLGPLVPDGVWVLEQAAHCWSAPRRILLTGAPNQRAYDAVRHGVVETLLIKPADRTSILLAATAPRFHVSAQPT